MCRTAYFVSVALAAGSCFAAFSQAAAQSNYVAIRMGSGGGLSGVGDGQQVGSLYPPLTGPQAILLSGTAKTLVTLTPSSYSCSKANDTLAGQQVGEVRLRPNSPPRAALWQGTADSFVELHPPGASTSRALATDGIQQVGVVDDHATLWTGSAASAVTLHYGRSQAVAVLNGVQAGWGSVPDQHALMWTGTAGSVVDLHPTGFSWSQVYGLGDGFQVGVGKRQSDGATRLLLWHGTAESATDVTPAGAPASFSVYDGAGAYIVGEVNPADAPAHAHVWSIYGEMTDLHTTLPSAYSTYGSAARGVDALGNAVGNLESGATDAVLWWRAGLLNPPTFTVGTDTFRESVTVDAGKSMNISSLLTVAEDCSLNLDGANITAGTTRLKTGSTLSGQGTVQGAIVGDAGSRITATGNLSLGNAGAFNSFDMAGTLEVGSARVNLNSKGFATLGGLTTISGGTLAAAEGVSLGAGRNLSGWGTVDAKVAAGFGSTIEATGDLVMGDANSYAGFTSDGELYVNSHAVSIHDKNEAVLGSLTQIDGGTLTAANGFLLENGKNLLGRGEDGDGGGLVSKGAGPETARFLNRGYVEGPDSESSDYLIFDLLFKASTGHTAGNLGFLGGYAPGDSPGWEQHDGNLLLGGTSPFEIGGPTPGDGDGYHSRLDVSGNLTFLEGAILEVLPWGGYVPELGHEFTILTWGETLSGHATITYDTWFADHGLGFEPHWNPNSLVLTVVPEPSAAILLAMGALGLLAYGWRQRKR